MPTYEQCWFGLQRAMSLDPTNIISWAHLDVTNAILIKDFDQVLKNF